MEQNLYDHLEYLSKEYMGIKASTIARNYIRLSEVFLIEPSGKLTTFDRQPVQVIPKAIFDKNLLEKLPERELFNLGDSLAILIETNLRLMQKNISSPEEEINFKLEIVKSLGWIEIREYGQFWGFSSRDMPLPMLNALLYRLRNGSKYNDEWVEPNILPYLDRSYEDLEKQAGKKDYREDKYMRNLHNHIREFKERLGCRKENFIHKNNPEKLPYFIYDTFRLPQPPPPQAENSEG